MKKVIKIISITIILVYSYSCSKNILGEESVIKGKWEIVNYTINENNVIENKKFYTTKFLFTRNSRKDNLVIYPLECDSCDGSQEYEVHIDDERTDFFVLYFSRGFMFPERTGWGLIPSQYRFQFDLNPLNYKSKNPTVYKGHSYFWEAKYLSNKILKISNMHNKYRVNDISVTFEKY